MSELYTDKELARLVRAVAKSKADEAASLDAMSRANLRRDNLQRVVDAHPEVVSATEETRISTTLRVEDETGLTEAAVESMNAANRASEASRLTLKARQELKAAIANLADFTGEPQANGTVRKSSKRTVAATV